MESVNSLRISAPPWWPLREGRDGKCEVRNEKCEFLARESVSSSPIVRIFGKGKCKFIANFSAKMVTSLPSISLSLCLYYRKRGSASYIVREVLSVRERERYRQRERDRERRKWRHHCRAKIGDEFTLSLAKNSHFSFLPSHFPSLPSRRGHHGGAEIRNEFTLSIAKTFFALRLCSPSFKWHEPRDEWSKTQDKWSNPAQSYYRKRGSASYIVREVHSVRERERERYRERQKWRHQCRAKIGDEFTLTLAKNSHFSEKDRSDVTSVALKLAMSVHFPLPKTRTFRFSLHISRLSLHEEA